MGRETFFVVLMLCLSVVYGKPNDSDDIVKETMDLWKAGQEQIVFDPNKKNLIIVIGNTGTGKSTLSRFIGSDNSKLIAYEVRKGTADFIIQNLYEKDETKTSTTISKTIFPELITDVDDQQIGYYDCPGFSDTRNASVEIATAYFTRSVIDYAEALKLVIAVNYPSVRVGVDRSDFVTLVKHVTDLVKNVARYKDGISMIATKVDNDGYADSVHIARIVAFLEEYNQTLTEETTFNINARAFVSALLTTNGEDEYPRLGLFRRPKESGPLSSSQHMIDVRLKLRNVIMNNTFYVAKFGEDFGYTISDRSKLNIIGLSKAINNQITKYTGKVGTTIEKHYQNYASRLGDLRKLKGTFHNGQKVLSQMNDKQDEATATPEVFLTKLVAVINRMKIQLSQEYLLKIAFQNKYFDFLEKANEAPLTSSWYDWVNALQACLQYLDSTTNWYTFLNGFYEDASHYEFQKYVKKFNVADVNKWGEGDTNTGILITPKNFNLFIQQLNKDDERYKYIEDFNPDKEQLKVLNDLLTITVKHQNQVKCDNVTLVITGDFVLLSNIDISSCKQANSMQIFALHTIFIDADIDAVGRLLNVSIISPKWQCVGSTTINLSGTDAEDVADGGAESGKTHDDTAAHGLSGLSGVNAGHFLGIGDDFETCEKFVIKANGGKGGNAQDGGYGFNSSHTVDVPKDSSYSCFLGLCSADPLGDITKLKNDGKFDDVKKCHNERDRSWSRTEGSGISAKTSYSHNEKFFCATVKCGGSGGDGGKGGFEGKSGSVRMFQLSKKFSIHMQNVDGSSGKDGQGGRIGDSNIVIVKFHIEDIIYGNSLLMHHYTTDWTVDSVEWNDACSNIAGVTGKYDRRKPQTPVWDFKTSFQINDFKNFSREHFHNDLKRDDLTSFYEKLDQNFDVASSYTTLGLVNELYQLENQYFRLNNVIDMKIFYESLLNRVHQHAENIKSKDKNVRNEQKRILQYLYTACMSKLWGLKTKSESNLIINIGEYLDLTIASINEWKQEENKKIVHEYKEAYKKNINNKISEANDFIKDQITTEVENINEQIGVKMEKLINETINMKNETEQELQDYKRQQETMKKNLVLRGLFGTMKVVGQFAGFLGPYGTAAGAVISGSAQIAEAFALDDQTSKQKPFSLPPGVKTALGKAESSFKTDYDTRVKNFDLLLADMSIEINPYKDVIGDTDEIINAIKAQIKDQGELPNLQDQLSKALKKKELEMKKDKVNLDKKGREALAGIEKCNKLFLVFDSAVEFYSKVAVDKAKLDELADSISKVQKKLQALQEFQSEIYRTMLPMIKSMQGMIEDLENNAGGQSHVALDISKWQVQSKLRDMKLDLKRYTEGYTVQEDLGRLVDKLDETMTTLINVFDRIQSYQEQEQFADYIADIQTASGDDPFIKDEILRQAVFDVKRVISTNILLGQYVAATSGFKQYVFPFIVYYLDAYKLPSDLEIDDKLTQLTTTAVRQLKGLKTKIHLTNITTTDNDVVINTDHFDSKLESTKPFYVWENKPNHEAITKLLAGQQIAVLADIDNGSQRNAIKFNFVQIHLKIVNTTEQATLDGLLKKFDVEMVHTGNSYYRCDSNIYVITSPKQKIRYSFENGNDGKPVRKNLVYDKIRGGDLMLSPYTMWTIQLINVNGNFDDLTPYVDLIKLELVGEGRFINENVSVCNAELNEYYEPEQHSDISILHAF